MNCSEVHDLLSDYYDNELSDDLREAVRFHLKTCTHCAGEIGAFEKISQLAGNLSNPVPPSELWGELETRLQNELKPMSRIVEQPGSRTPLKRIPKYSLLLVATTLLLVIGVCYLYHEQTSHLHSSSVFIQYVAAFVHNPDSAQQILLKNYQNDFVSPEQAVKLLGYEPAIVRSLPAGYEMQASYVMKMPCCTCLQTICKRKDGSSLVIFEHDDETPEWFEGQSKINTSCNGEKCCLVNLEQRIAASWKHDKRHVTVIGIRDVSEVNELIAWSNPSRKKL